MPFSSGIGKLYNVCHRYVVDKVRNTDREGKKNRSILRYFGNIFTRKYGCARTHPTPQARVSTPFTSRRRQSSVQRVCGRSGRRLIVPRDAQHATNDQFGDNWMSFYLNFLPFGWVNTKCCCSGVEPIFLFHLKQVSWLFDKYHPIVFYYYKNLLLK